MKPIPPLSVDLLNELDAAYPARWPHPHENEREIWMQAGARKLIDGLLLRKEQRPGNLLKLD